MCVGFSPSLSLAPPTAGVAEAAAADGEAGFPHGAAEVCGDESTSTDGATGSGGRCSSAWTASPVLPSRSPSPRTRSSSSPRRTTSISNTATRYEPWAWISHNAPPHGTPPSSTDRSAHTCTMHSFCSEQTPDALLIYTIQDHCRFQVLLTQNALCVCVCRANGWTGAAHAWPYDAQCSPWGNAWSSTRRDASNDGLQTPRSPERNV